MLRLPWEEFLAKAYELNRERLDEIEADDDLDNAWQLDTPLFHFAHLVWSRPDLGGDARRPAALLVKIERTLERWSASQVEEGQQPPEGLTSDPWQDWFGVSREEAKTQFLDSWPKFRFPAGHTPLDAAVELARRHPLTPLDDVCQRRLIERANPTVGYCFFLSICGHLQALVGDKPIFLPQEQLGEHLHVSGRTVSSWRRWAVEDGYLRLTRPAGPNRAAEYRFDVSRWPLLKNKAPRGTAEGYFDREWEREDGR